MVNMVSAEEILLEDEVLEDCPEEDADEGEEPQEEREERVLVYDDERDEEGCYEACFSLSLSGFYIDKDGKAGIEYDLLYEEIDPLNEKAPADQTVQFDDPAEVPEAMTLEYERDALHHVRDADYPAEILDDVINISYEKPEFINGQKTYQRIVFEADVDGESVYELTMRKLKDAGIDAKAEYDGDFDSMIFTSINGMEEGYGDNFNEFYLNGEIGANAADLEDVKKGDLIEWRYAEETDGSCGGVPDFSQIKSMVQYNVAAKAHADSLGLLLN